MCVFLCGVCACAVCVWGGGGGGRGGGGGGGGGGVGGGGGGGERLQKWGRAWVCEIWVFSEGGVAVCG